MRNAHRPTLLLAFAALALGACSKPSMPDAPPTPKAGQPASEQNTQMRDAIKKPLDEAKAAAALEQQAAQQQRKQADAETDGNTKPDESQQ